MNQPDITGALADGGRYMATSYMLEVTREDGSLVGTIDTNDMKGVRRNGTTVTIQRQKAADVVLQGATIDDAGRLESALRASNVVGTQQVKSGGGVGKFFLFGCGGLIVVVIIIVIAAVAASAGNKKSSSGTSAKANITTYSQEAIATTKELSMTLSKITDPFTSSNQFEQPKPGNRYIVYHVSATNVDKSPHTVNEFSFKLKTDDNHVYDPTFVVTADTGFKAFSLSKGEITEGDVAFEVPSSAQVTELRYDNGLGSDDLFWRK